MTTRASFHAGHVGLQAAALVVLLLGLSACARDTHAAHPSDGDAVALCRHALQDVTDQKTLASTVSSGPNGWLVKSWTSGKPVGSPDYICNLARDKKAPHGVNLLQVTPSRRGMVG